jgi:hypothetical protein
MGVRVQTLTNPRDTPLGVGFGALIITTPANPAPGAELVITVPANRIWRLVAVSALFTASIAVATRIATWQITDGTNLAWYIDANVPKTATQAGTFAMADMAFRGATNAFGSIVPCPNFTYLRSGWVVKTYTANIDAADQWSNATLWVNSWAAVMP